MDKANVWFLVRNSKKLDAWRGLEKIVSLRCDRVSVRGIDRNVFGSPSHWRSYQQILWKRLITSQLVQRRLFSTLFSLARLIVLIPKFPPFFQYRCLSLCFTFIFHQCTQIKIIVSTIQILTTDYCSHIIK